MTDGGDSGAPDQYRAQVAAANQQGGSNRVVVAVPKVTLGSASIDVTSNLTVTPNSGSVEISGSATHFLDNAGSTPLSFTLDKGVTLDSAGLEGQDPVFGPQPVVLEARAGAWNITIDGAVRTPMPALCIRTSCTIGTSPTAVLIDQPGSTLTIGPTGVIDATLLNPQSDPTLSGNEAVRVSSGTTVNINGGTVEQAGSIIGSAAIQGGVVNLTMTGGSVTSWTNGISSGPMSTLDPFVGTTANIRILGGSVVGGQAPTSAGIIPDLISTVGIAVTGPSVVEIGPGATVQGYAAVSDVSLGSEPVAGTKQIIVGGTITGTSGVAVEMQANPFADRVANDIFTLEPTGVVNGKVIYGTNTLVTASVGFRINAITAVGGGTQTFQLGGTGNGTFDLGLIGPSNGLSSAQYEGFSVFQKVGTSTWTVTGSASQPWTVMQGTLVVDGSIGGPVSVTGGVLGGSGSVGGLNVLAGGTVAPGHSIGTLTVNGDVSFAGGSTYQVEISPAGAGDKIVASGAATLSGGAVQVIGIPSTLSTSSRHLQVVPDANGLTGQLQQVASSPPARFTILTAAGGVSGTFSAVTSDTPTITPALSYDANDVFLTLTPMASTIGSIGLTRNEFASGRALLGLASSTPLLAAVQNLSVASAVSAFDMTSGELHASVQEAIADQSRRLREAALARLRSDATAADGANGLSIWAGYQGGRFSINGDSNAAQLISDGGSAIMGVDVGILGRLRLGAVYAHGWGEATIAERLSRANWTSDEMGLYAGGAWGPLSARVGGSYAWHNVTTDRQIIFSGFQDRAQASYKGDSLQGFGELALKLPTGAAATEAFGQIAAVRVQLGSFTEQGGAAALTGSKRSLSTDYSELGLRTSLPVVAGVSLTGSAAWQHVFGDRLPEAVLSESGGPAFTVIGPPLERDSARLSAGVTLALGRRGTFDVGYTGTLGDRSTENELQARLAFRF